MRATVDRTGQLFIEATGEEEIALLCYALGSGGRLRERTCYVGDFVEAGGTLRAKVVLCDPLEEIDRKLPQGPIDTANDGAEAEFYPPEHSNCPCTLIPPDTDPRVIADETPDASTRVSELGREGALSAAQADVLAYLRASGPAGTTAIRNAVAPDVSPQAVGFRLNKLALRGLVVREGSGRSARWRAVDAAAPTGATTQPEIPSEETDVEQGAEQDPHDGVDADPQDDGRGAVNIGDGRGHLPDGGLLALAVDALRVRAPAWCTPDGIVEICASAHLAQHLTSDAVSDAMTQQRRLRTYRIVGLEARERGMRWEYRMIRGS